MKGYPSGLGVALAVFLVAMGSNSAHAQLSKDNAKCRKAIGGNVKKLTNVLVGQLEKCHKGRMLGIVPASIDCNDPNALPTDLAAKVVRVQDKLSAAVAKTCAASTPAGLNYVVCPDPCGTNPGGANIVINGFAGVSSCMICLAQDRSKDVMTSAYGSPPTPAGGDNTLAAACQNTVGKGLAKYLIARMGEQQRCQYKLDRGKIANPSGGCQSADLKGLIAKALTKSNELIAQCTAGTLTALDSCGNDVAPEQTCIRDAAIVGDDDLFNDIYFPAAPTPTPTGVTATTPTETATSTPTRSATATPTETATHTPTETATSAPTQTATSTPTQTATSTPTQTATGTPTNSPTVTPTATTAACTLECQHGGTLLPDECACDCGVFKGNVCQDYDCFEGNTDMPFCSGVSEEECLTNPDAVAQCPQTCLCSGV